MLFHNNNINNNNNIKNSTVPIANSGDSFKEFIVYMG